MEGCTYQARLSRVSCSKEHSSSRKNVYLPGTEPANLLDEQVHWKMSLVSSTSALKAGGWRAQGVASDGRVPSRESTR